MTRPGLMLAIHHSGEPLPEPIRVSAGFFFFSSRRRHTRFDCDWSSDVCSSDLPRTLSAGLSSSLDASRKRFDPAATFGGFMVRSEERRVGKECSSQWSAAYYKEKHPR